MNPSPASASPVVHQIGGSVVGAQPLWRPDSLDSGNVNLATGIGSMLTNTVQHNTNGMVSTPSPYSINNAVMAAKSLSLETESILSGFSDRSKKLRHNGTAAYAGILNHNNSPNTNSIPMVIGQNHLMANNLINPYHGNYQTTNTPQMAQVNSVISLRSNGRQSATNFLTRNEPIDQSLYTTAPAVHRQEVLEVQSMTHDDNWGDNTTAITGNTSDQSGSLEDISKLTGKESETISMPNSFQMQCKMWSGTVIASVLSICAFFSPILMVILPQVDMLEWKTKECGPECDGLVISFVFKLLILAVGSWAVFLRRPKATMPRIYVYRTAVLALIVIFMVAYWLFFSVRIAEKRFNEEDAISYYNIILFAISLVDALLFIHYLAVILLEVRHLDAEYFIKVVRSPDGHSACYNIGKISIQRASVWVLEKYYQEFSIYNPHLDRIALRRTSRKNSAQRHGLKYYDVDGVTGPSSNKKSFEPNAGNGNGNSTTPAPTNNMNLLQLSPKSILAQNTAANAGRLKNGTYMNGGSTISDGRGNLNKRGRSGQQHSTDRDATSQSGHHRHHRHHSDRFYDEHEYERRVRKRKARLVSVTEEAFTHIKRVQKERTGPSIPMNPKEAAQAIFPSIAKMLQKFLRVTRQHTRHSMQSILEHLTICLTYDLGPKAFLEKYFTNGPVLANDHDKRPIQTWNLICDTLVSRSIEAGTMFLLRQDDVSLLITVHRLPHFNLVEEVIDSANNKFIFKLNSETSV